MPVLFHIQVSEHCRLAVWELTEDLEALTSKPQLNANDLWTLDTFKHLTRKKQWIASRILANSLTNNANTRIIYDKFNKPQLENSSAFISVSHSHNLVSVIINDKESTGIDIELIQPKIVTISSKFLSNNELENIQTNINPEILSVYWCAKESLYKQYGKKELIFKENIHIAPFSYSSNGGVLKGSILTQNYRNEFSLKYIKYGNYMITYILPTSN